MHARRAPAGRVPVEALPRGALRRARPARPGGAAPVRRAGHGALPGLTAAFVDPIAYSFRTYENILPLDRYFATADFSIALDHVEPLAATGPSAGHRFVVRAGERGADWLALLDELGLYATPLDPASRGGRRFVFHSAWLADRLTEAVRRALPPAVVRDLVHVNPVFRCNRFEPDDAPFASHVDTPYYDAARRHVSKHTLLLYLTGGRGPEVLRIGDRVRLTEVPAMTGLVVPQGLEHAGAPYVDGRKVFLRTELIHEDPDLDHDPAIARAFAKACWLTGETLQRPELSARCHELYDRAAQAHFGGPVPDDDDVWLHKRYDGIDWVANGYDFWFPPAADLREAAVVTLLDVLDATVGRRPFRAQVETRRVGGPEALDGLDGGGTLTSLDPRVLLPDVNPPDETICCPFHGADSDTSLVPAIVDALCDATDTARSLIFDNPVQVLGQTVFFEPSRVLVSPGRVQILSRDRLEPVNFASCWNNEDVPGQHIGVAATVSSLQPLVPPILYRRTPRGLHLMFDLFRNDWMVGHTQRDVPVPYLRDLYRGGVDYDDESWWRQPFAEALGEEPR